MVGDSLGAVTVGVEYGVSVGFGFSVRKYVGSAVGVSDGAALGFSVSAKSTNK